MNERCFQVSQNYFNQARNGYVTSFIAVATNDFKVGETINFEETTHDGFQLSGRMLTVVIRNVGVNVKGLRRGYVIVNYSVF
jgi:hypothetical protein